MKYNLNFFRHIWGLKVATNLTFGNILKELWKKTSKWWLKSGFVLDLLSVYSSLLNYGKSSKIIVLIFQSSNMVHHSAFSPVSHTWYFLH